MRILTVCSHLLWESLLPVGCLSSVSEFFYRNNGHSRFAAGLLVALLVAFSLVSKRMEQRENTRKNHLQGMPSHIHHVSQINGWNAISLHTKFSGEYCYFLFRVIVESWNHCLSERRLSQGKTQVCVALPRSARTGGCSREPQPAEGYLFHCLVKKTH